MAEPFEAWRSGDGTFFDTKEEAEAYEAQLTTIAILETLISGYDWELDLDSLAAKKEDLTRALNQWDGKLRQRK